MLEGRRRTHARTHRRTHTRTHTAVLTRTRYIPWLSPARRSHLSDTLHKVSPRVVQEGHPTQRDTEGASECLKHREKIRRRESAGTTRTHCQAERANIRTHTQYTLHIHPLTRAHTNLVCTVRCFRVHSTLRQRRSQSTACKKVERCKKRIYQGEDERQKKYRL